MEKRSERHKQKRHSVWLPLILALAVLGIAAAGIGFWQQKGGGPVIMTNAQKQEAQERLTAERAELLKEAQRLYLSYDYDGAEVLLATREDLASEEINKLQEQISAARQNLVKYEGKIHHVFFHSLIVYPELAFDGDYRSAGYNMWMTTKDEFVAMLPKLQERGYVLYDLEALMQLDADGKMTQKDIYLPPGKIPLILSVDDVCYYDYMQSDGFAQRLTINEAGDVVTVVRDAAGNEQETYDGDVMPIIDQYVQAHPDFSYQGAKGVVAVTGYQGAFGYRITDLEGDELETAIAKAKAVADRLKETGWRMASHSYTHNGYFRDGSVTMEQLISDTTRWQELITPAVGQTNIFISPFGIHFKADDERFRYLVEQGFNIYCPVSTSMALTFNGDNMVQDRFNLDGYTMMKKPELVKELYFDPAEILDPLRPAL